MEGNAYEQERARRIAQNKAKLEALGVAQAVDDIKSSMAAERDAARKQRAARKAAKDAARASARAAPRRSSRVEGQPAPNYNENAMILALADGMVADKRDRRLLKENVSIEEYGLEHLQALGDHEQEWELFVDGYDAQGNRIYDKVNGQTCHQCRQKTLGKRTSCSQCQSLQGVFCGDCLFMRYGENVEEATANPNWVCPPCRDLCNCSFHRSRRGWAPTGTLYRRAAAEGYKSVAHYLVLNNLAPEAKPAALALAPPELRAELEKEIKEAEASTSGTSGDAGDAATEAEAGAASEQASAAEATAEPASSSEAPQAAAAEAGLLAPEAEPDSPEAPAAGKTRGRATRGRGLAATGHIRKASTVALVSRKAASKATPAPAPRRGLRSAAAANA
eukprot:scaffold2.g6806.t1